MCRIPRSDKALTEMGRSESGRQTLSGRTGQTYGRQTKRHLELPSQGCYLEFMNSGRFEDLEYSRSRRRRRRHVTVHINRRVEIWAVAGVSLALLGASISWILSAAYPTGQQTATSPSAAPAEDQASQSPAVIILEDKSGGRTDPSPP